MSFGCRVVALSAAALIAGCAAQRAIQPEAAGLATSQVATIVMAQGSKSGLSAALERVTDPRGKNVVGYNLLNADTRNTAVVMPGSYEIGVICNVGSQLLEPSAKFQLRGGYTYTLDCNRVGGFGIAVGVSAMEVPTVPTR